eukprot:m.24184 g.24184  ORF g.24184 m.24184 type:complete len:566 (+) comp7583_c0_seq2:205-1902(+)
MRVFEGFADQGTEPLVSSERHPPDNDEGKPATIVIDGGLMCHAGWAGSKLPVLSFPNLIARPRARKAEQPAILVGRDIFTDTVRTWITRSPLERGVVTDFVTQELVFDHIFSNMIANTENSTLEHPILMTEPLCCPSVCRAGLSELLFECYGAPKVSYGVSSLFSLEHNMPGIENSLIISCGSYATEIIPVLNKTMQGQGTYRLDYGLEDVIIFMRNIIRCKYPNLMDDITYLRARELVSTHCYIPENYMEEVRNFEDPQFLNSKTHVIVVKKQKKTESQTGPKIKMAFGKMLIVEPKEENPLPEMSEEEEKLLKEDQAQWVTNARQERHRLQSQHDRMQRQKEALGNRHSFESKKRMRLLVQQAEDKEDTFGKNDTDWNVYKEIGPVQSELSKEDAVRLENLDRLLKAHDPHYYSATEWSSPKEGELHLSVERCQVPEILFQPSISGSKSQGLGDLLSLSLAKFSRAEQDLLCGNVFITGEGASIQGLKERIEAEIRMRRPFNSNLVVNTAENIGLDGWRGASSFAKSSEFESACVTRQSYDEHGSDYLAEHRLSNTYLSQQTS